MPRHYLRWTSCPECGAEVRPKPFVDPITRKEYPGGTVEHEPGCRIYRECDFDRERDIAHLQALHARDHHRPTLSTEERGDG